MFNAQAGDLGQAPAISHMGPQARSRPPPFSEAAADFASGHGICKVVGVSLPQR